MKALGIDIGGSALKCAPVDTTTGALTAERYRVETPKPLTPAAMAKVVGDLVSHFKWRGPIGIGFPGVIHGSRIMTSANLDPAFVGVDGGHLFGRAAKQPVHLLNDAAAAAHAEVRFGAGKGFRGKILLLTLGTGVGSALAFRETIIPCEFGHIPFKHRDAEKYVAASVKHAKDLSWKKWGHRLHGYIRMLENAVWPELIIIGGGVSARHDKFFKFIKPRAKLVPAEFLNEAGIVGAAMWAVEERGREVKIRRRR